MLKHAFAPCIEGWFYPEKQFLWKQCNNATDYLSINTPSVKANSAVHCQPCKFNQR